MPTKRVTLSPNTPVQLTTKQVAFIQSIPDHNLKHFAFAVSDTAPTDLNAYALSNELSVPNTMSVWAWSNLGVSMDVVVITE